jgi:hypothetical protein
VEPGRLEAAHRLLRHDAERAAAVGDHLTIVLQLLQVLLELIERDRTGALDVTGGKLVARTHVDQHDVSPPHPGDQLVGVDRVHLLAEVVARGALDLRQSLRRRVAQGEP